MYINGGLFFVGPFGKLYSSFDFHLYFCVGVCYHKHGSLKVNDNLLLQMVYWNNCIFGVMMG